VCLEVVEVAPIEMVKELPLGLLRIDTGQRDDINTLTRLVYLFGTWQVIGLLRLRWSHAPGLDGIEDQCREILRQSLTDFQLLVDLVAVVCSIALDSTSSND
jgi:hypothetical protein